jgi:hypothetical protein
MDAVSFTSRSFHVEPVPEGEREVVLSTLVGAADARALAAALAWHRAKEYLAPAVEDADRALALRAVVAVHDQLEDLGGEESQGGPITFREPQMALLAEVAMTYVAERDADGYQDPAERERLATLRSLSGPLFDLVAAFAGAREEAKAEGLLSSGC